MSAHLSPSFRNICAPLAGPGVYCSRSFIFFSLSSFSCVLVVYLVIHAVEVAFESIQVRGPEPAEGSQPGIDLLKWFRFQPVEAALCVHRGFDEAGLAQHPQVFGHGRLGHTKLTLDLSHRLLRRDQEAQDRAAVRLRNDFEHRFHSLYILHRAYACQDI